MAQLLLAVPLAFHLIAASGNGSGVPTFDVRPSCRAEAMAQVTVTQGMRGCMADEQDAHDPTRKGMDEVQCFRPGRVLAHRDRLRANLH